jgi:hypothetical protein
MGYSTETNDINFSSGTTAFYGFLGFLINGESTNGAGLSESNVQMPFSPGTISLLWCRVTTAATSSSTVTLRKNSTNTNNTFSHMKPPFTPNLDIGNQYVTFSFPVSTNRKSRTFCNNYFYRVKEYNGFP